MATIRQRFIALAGHLKGQDSWVPQTEQAFVSKMDELMEAWEQEYGTLPPLLEYAEGNRYKMRWPQGFNR